MRSPTPVPATRPLTINRGDSVVIAGPGGTISPGSRDGFYARDTRFLSAHVIRIDGRPLEPVEDAPIRFYSVRHELRSVPVAAASGSAPLEIGLERSVRDGVHEEIDVRNPGPEPVRTTLSVELAADFADLFEVRGLDVPAPRRRPQVSWNPERAELRVRHHNGAFRRAVRVRCERSGSLVAWLGDRLAFELDLAPGATWHTCLIWEPIFDDAASDGPAATDGSGATASLAPPECRMATRLVAEREGRPVAGMRLTASNPDLQAAWDQASWDMEALRLRVPEVDAEVPAAGVPWFLTLFGRDSTITAMQALPGYRDLAVGTLRALAAYQATTDGPEQDREPGKLPHEIRHGEVAQLGLLPFQPYYGTHDATPLYLVLLGALHRWHPEMEGLGELLPVAERAMQWIEGAADRDGDGFVEYATRSRHGFPNQGWKDAVEAVPHADGSLASLPIALSEHQGYAYDARLALAGLYEAVGRARDAARLRAAARDLYERFNEMFWWEAEGTYLLGLDGQKRPIRSVASNAGHCLASGIVPPDRAPRVAARLLADDMWSGWGVRTLSAEHRAYDPISYHTGSVWPHDNAIIASGFARYGLTDGVARIARALIDACALLPDRRLPELYAGLDRQAGVAPAAYPGACVPQAWAASALFRVVILLCGLEVRRDRAGARIELDPRLPAWAGRVGIEGIGVGRGRLSFVAEGERATVFENSTGLPVTRRADGATDGPPPKGP